MATNGTSNASSDVTDVDFLVVGMGPAGAGLACFLAQNKLKGLVVTNQPSTANTPRAHIMSMAALDCLRDIGVDKQCYEVGTNGDTMAHTIWSSSMAGEEYARIHAWGNSPKRKGDYELASPSVHIDLPQWQLEPILTTYASQNGFRLRFDTEHVSFEQLDNGEGIVSTLRDRLTGHTYRVKAKYLFGADGGRSRIAEALQLPFVVKPGGGPATNVLVEADLSHLMKNRVGNLHWVMQADRETPDWAALSCVRMVKPWSTWVVGLVHRPGSDRQRRSDEEYVNRIREIIGDDSVDIKILGVSTWNINEIYADRYSKGDVFCLGDAVHRHPPNHGLGSNTCIQDAHNLAWKVAYVQRGWAGKELLSSFNDERQPVGQDIVTQANESSRNHLKIWQILGCFEPGPEAGKAALSVLKEASPRGHQRRNDFQAALRLLDREEHGLGIEMNQRYRSTAVYHEDEKDGPPPFDKDPLEHYHPTTYPGSRLPHVWLSDAIPSAPISTIDLAGKTRFTLITGIGGDGWRHAAEEATKTLGGVPLEVYQIGFRQQYEDRYNDWAKLRGVTESGCVLVRPDYFVAWRCQEWEDGSAEKLLHVLKAVLSR
ncbi:FAD binding domain-containing protein [Microdochium trichocladiopsis]|uniref:FAD binding domain-containing protein n=1 Tax=Microdochium trichocladiopsis TaxID=1682393 RepID=A0A9P9BJ49_9PEZI|nr:FAD binding domain-containing protein [Microdochium trichocladiopsis]KAH7016421.1 FAD binding domain-containing protein [Microdochium trichocladiopsis]